MRFSYAVVALFGAAHAMPRVGSLVTGRSVCNDATADCKGVARAVVADQAALEARKKSKAAKTDAANATAAAGGDNNNKRSKKLFQVEARANETASDVEARALGDAVSGLVGDVTGTVGDVTNTVGDVAGGVGLKTRDGKEVRAAAAVTDDAALEDIVKNRQAKASNATAEARSVDGGLAKKQASNATADAGAAEARKSRKSRKGRKARRSHQLW